MWPFLIALVGAIASLVLPVLIFWYITTHFQQIQNGLKQAFTYPGIAVGSTVTPLVLGGLAFFGGLAAIGIGFYYSEKRIGGPKVRPPELAPISLASYPSAAAVSAAGYAPFPSIGYSGQGFSVGAGSHGLRPSGRVVRSSRRR